MPTFATAINCMDGRTQLPVINYLKWRFEADYVDAITEPGPVRILADDAGCPAAQSIFDRVDISVAKHESRGIAVVAHHDCAGNPLDKPDQLEQLRRAIDVITSMYPDLPVIGLWVDDAWHVHEM